MLAVEIDKSLKLFDLTIHETFSPGITGIYGRSGAGKSSMLKSIAGIIKPDQGLIQINDRVLFDSENKINVPIEKRRIGYVFQEGRLFPHMTVERNLKYGIRKASHSLDFDAIVDAFELEHILRSKPDQISGGEMQRVALGRALLSSPQILLLDEPFSAVDYGLRDQILPFINKMQALVNIPILVISHDLQDLLKLSYQLCVIDQGQCKAHGSYFELLRNEQIASFLQTSPLLNAIDLVVQSSQQNDLTILGNTYNPQLIKVSFRHARAGQVIRVFIDPRDIALSLHRVENITIQNQVKGTIVSIIKRSGSYLCLINVGFDLIAEITSDSLNKMKLDVGMDIWCLFKSVAVESQQTS